VVAGLVQASSDRAVAAENLIGVLVDNPERLFGVRYGVS